MSSEKIAESKLTNILTIEKFDTNKLYYHPAHNEKLKLLFKNTSKNNKSNIGVPDRIYFDNNTIIIFECKSNDIKLAVIDIKFYINKLINNIEDNNEYNIYGVAFINESNYIIYKVDNNKFKKINNTITLNTFDLEKSSYNSINMNKSINNINNYIRDNTKISNEDKPFFIAIILISLQKESFRFNFNLYDSKCSSKKYIYDLLKDNLNEFEIDISIFEFFKNDENNIHFYNIIKKVMEVFNNNPDIDLLNEFYSEFVKYNNTDGKSLGIVLTPPHIVKLMVELLNINQNDIVLDLCTGTGSFLLESLKYNPTKIIGCEYQTKLFTLLKCNMILRGINNYNIIKGDCFDYEFKATKSIINPPYGMKDKSEYDFILKQIESLEENGEACAIIPISRLHNNKSNNKFKKMLLEICYIRCIILCRKTLFYPSANVHCCILLIKKTKNNCKRLTKIINYMDDGIILIKQNGLVITDSYNDKYNNLLDKLTNDNCYTKLLKYNDGWNIIDNLDEICIDLNKIELYKLELEYQIKKQQL